MTVTEPSELIIFSQTLDRHVLGYGDFDKQRQTGEKYLVDGKTENMENRLS